MHRVSAHPGFSYQRVSVKPLTFSLEVPVFNQDNHNHQSIKLLDTGGLVCGHLPKGPPETQEVEVIPPDDC